MDARSYRDAVLFTRLLRQGRPFWPHLTGIFGLGLLATPLALLTPLPLKIAVDALTGSRALPAFLERLLPAAATHSVGSIIVVAAVLLVAVALLEQLRQLASTMLGVYTGQRLELDMRSRLFERVQRLSLAYHDARGTADSLYRIQYDAECIQWIAIYGIAPFVTAVLTLGGMIVVTAQIDWELALVSLVVAPALLLLTFGYRRTLRNRWHQTKELESSALSVVHEVLNSLRLVKAFAQEDREQERFLDRSHAAIRARLRVYLIEGLFGLLSGLTLAAGMAVALYVGAGHVRSGALTAGDLTLVLGYLTQLYAPLQQIGKSIITLQSSLAGAERALSLLDEPADVPESTRPHRLRRALGAVEFRDVGFSYDGLRPVLGGVSFELAPGTRLGIAGPTGVGKTTLVNLLMRFYDPTGGAVLLDGVDLREYKLADLRSQFGVVLQEPILFSATVAENIAYARPRAADDEIATAARAARIHDFVSALPDGYATLVGERGMRLSGGERQRISLARAFLKDAPILILDEPTSSVDVETEAAIVEAMDRLMEGRTTFLIAHRLTTLDVCDRRIELRDGCLLPLPHAVARDGRNGRQAETGTRPAEPGVHAEPVTHAREEP